MSFQQTISLAAARAAGVRSLSLDPGIGFGFRWAPTMDARVAYQSHVLLETFRLRALGLPLCHALPAARHLWGEEVRSAEHFFAVLAHLGALDRVVDTTCAGSGHVHVVPGRPGVGKGTPGLRQWTGSLRHRLKFSQYRLGRGPS